MNDGLWRYSNERNDSGLGPRRRTGISDGRHGLRRVPPADRPPRAGPDPRARHPLHQCHAAAADLRHPHRQHALLRDCAGHGLAGLRRDRRARQVPDARRGDRMMESNDIPVWVAILTAFFVVAGASLTLIGCLGLLPLESFYQRIHAPPLGSTLGTGTILIGSIIFFSALAARPLLHEILIAVFVTVTPPVPFILLVRATRHRDTDPAVSRKSTGS